MNLLEPLHLADRTLANRVVFGPIATNLANGRAFSDRHVAFYGARAAGGCAMVVTEHASVHESDWPYERCPSADVAGPGWAAIGETCHRHGTVVVAGLSHAGGQSTSAFSQREIWAPSDEPDVNTREVPKIMERADIDAVINGFADAAAAAVSSGLDGVEINAGQFSLVRQFLSGLTNRRDDVYGEDRSLFACQILEAVRGRIGKGHILGLRLSCDELAPWAGITPGAAVDLAAEFGSMLDYLTVERGAIFSVTETRPTAHHPPGFNLDLASQVRAAVDGVLPVFAQGSIISIDQANRAIEAGQCDGVEMTRAQLADSNLVKNANAGRPIRPCVLCNQLCNVRDNRNPIISCIADPRCGHETRDAEEPAHADTRTEARPETELVTDDGGTSGGAAGKTRPDVLVIGGGPAGLEAARVAARRGLSVTLHERSDRVGGMANTAAVAPAHQPLKNLTEWLTEDAITHGVEIKTNSPVGPDQIDAFLGEVIIATGSVAGPLAYKISDDATVVDAVDVLTAIEAGNLDDLLPNGKIVVWDPGGGAAGVAVTELLAGQRSEVSLATPDGIAGNMLSLTGDLAGSNVRLQQAGVTIIKRQRLIEVTAEGVVLEHAFVGERQVVPAAAVVDVSARYPNEELLAEDNTAKRTGTRVGDAVAPRTVGDAIREGRAAGMEIRPAAGQVSGTTRGANAS